MWRWKKLVDPLPEGMEWINITAHKQNTYYCQSCPHTMEWHSSIPPHHCQLCRFSNGKDEHPYIPREKTKKDLPWEVYLKEITDVHMPEKKMGWGIKE